MLTSQVSAVVDARCGTVSSCREEIDELRSALSSGSVDCALAMASKSMAGVCVTCRVSTGTRESASATGLAPPLTCLMSAVNWEMKSR